MHISFDIWIGGTGFGFTIWIWETKLSPMIILGTDGQIKLFDKELANWIYNWEGKETE